MIDDVILSETVLDDFTKLEIAEQLKPINEAWKQRIRKFQKIILFTFSSTFCILGTFLVIRIATPQTTIATKIPIAAIATPSKLQYISLYCSLSRPM